MTVSPCNLWRQKGCYEPLSKRGRQIAKRHPQTTNPHCGNHTHRSPVARIPVARIPVARSPVARSPVARSPVARIPRIETVIECDLPAGFCPNSFKKKNEQTLSSNLHVSRTRSSSFHPIQSIHHEQSMPFLLQSVVNKKQLANVKKIEATLDIRQQLEKENALQILQLLDKNKAHDKTIMEQRHAASRERLNTRQEQQRAATKLRYDEEDANYSNKLAKEAENALQILLNENETKMKQKHAASRERLKTRQEQQRAATKLRYDEEDAKAEEIRHQTIITDRTFHNLIRVNKTASIAKTNVSITLSENLDSLVHAYKHEVSLLTNEVPINPSLENAVIAKITKLKQNALQYIDLQLYSTLEKTTAIEIIKNTCRSALSSFKRNPVLSSKIKHDTRIATEIESNLATRAFRMVHKNDLLDSSQLLVAVDNLVKNASADLHTLSLDPNVTALGIQSLTRIGGALGGTPDYQELTTASSNLLKNYQQQASAHVQNIKSSDKTNQSTNAIKHTNAIVDLQAQTEAQLQNLPKQPQGVTDIATTTFDNIKHLLKKNRVEWWNEEKKDEDEDEEEEDEDKEEEDEEDEDEDEEKEDEGEEDEEKEDEDEEEEDKDEEEEDKDEEEEDEDTKDEKDENEEDKDEDDEDEAKVTVEDIQPKDELEWNEDDVLEFVQQAKKDNAKAAAASLEKQRTAAKAAAAASLEKQRTTAKAAAASLDKRRASQLANERALNEAANMTRVERAASEKKRRKAEKERKTKESADRKIVHGLRSRNKPEYLGKRVFNGGEN